MEKVLNSTDEQWYLAKLDECHKTISHLQKELAKKGEQKVNGSENDNILHPSHYCFANFEPKDVIHDWGLNFDCGNAIKYIARAGKKEGNSKLQDLKKAKQYLEFEIEFLERERVQR